MCMRCAWRCASTPATQLSQWKLEVSRNTQKAHGEKHELEGRYRYFWPRGRYCSCSEGWTRPATEVELDHRRRCLCPLPCTSDSWPFPCLAHVQRKKRHVSYDWYPCCAQARLRLHHCSLRGHWAFVPLAWLRDRVACVASLNLTWHTKDSRNEISWSGVIGHLSKGEAPRWARRFPCQGKRLLGARSHRNASPSIVPSSSSIGEACLPPPSLLRQH